MDDAERQEMIGAARAYEGLHVPALFAEWVEPVMDAARVACGQRVLDVACGTGVLARAAARRTGPGGSVVGVDPNRGMLAVAAELSPGIEWRQGTAEDLPLPDASVDAVVSQFGMMFFADASRAVREMLRVLKPGATLAVAVWDALERSPAYSREVDLLERVAGKAAADALRAPFVMGDPEALVELFEGAGAASPQVSTRMGEARFPSVRVMVEADLRGWLPVMGVTLAEPLIERILDEAEDVLASFVREGGEVVFDSPAHIVSGTKPAIAPG